MGAVRKYRLKRGSNEYQQPTIYISSEYSVHPYSVHPYVRIYNRKNCSILYRRIDVIVEYDLYQNIKPHSSKDVVKRLYFGVIFMCVNFVH